MLSHHFILNKSDFNESKSKGKFFSLSGNSSIANHNIILLGFTVCFNKVSIVLYTVFILFGYEVNETTISGKYFVLNSVSTFFQH